MSQGKQNGSAHARRLDLRALARRLSARTPSRAFRWLRARRAAIAIILDPAGRVLLMKRAEREGDRWSSHVSLPGGMQQPSDASLLATAARETREELSVDVSSMEHLGALDEVRAIANGGYSPMSIAPFVFLAREAIDASPGPEVASAFWLPLDRAASGALDDRMRYPVLGVPFRFACWRFEGHTIWGLTFGVLQTVLRLARP